MPKIKRKRTTRNKQTNDDIPGMRPNKLVIVPPSESIIPDRVYVRLTYPVIANLTIVAAGTSAATRYRPSAAYDVDPTLGSTSTPGFSEWASLYSNYRVLASKAKVTFVNTNNGSGATAVLIPLTADPGAAPSTATITAWTANPFAVTRPVGVAGSVPCILSSRKMSTERIIGTKMVYTDDNFSALTSGVPTTNWYWGIGIVIPLALGGNLVVNANYEITMWVEFFSRKSLIA